MNTSLQGPNNKFVLNLIQMAWRKRPEERKTRYGKLNE